MLDAARQRTPHRVSHRAVDRALLSAKAPRRLGDILIGMGAISQKHLDDALTINSRQATSLANVLLARGFVSQGTLRQAQELRWNAGYIDFAIHPPDPRLIPQVGVDFCLKHGIIPVIRYAGGGLVVATAHPERFAAVEAELTATFGPLHMALTDQRSLEEEILQLDLRHHARKAEYQVAAAESCRNWNSIALKRWFAAIAVAISSLIFYSPALTFSLFCGWAVATLFLSTLLKLAACIAQRNHAHNFQHAQSISDQSLPDGHVLPRVSILVPLYHEREIATHLVARLRRLRYPRELLEICLVTEADDKITAATLAEADLPPWFRVIPVPDGRIRTKPRAMNFALDFCKGSIIGIYDAEDAPDPDQIQRVVNRFARRGPEVACLQGVLDYYNAKTNWLSRCFTIEYATWFRLVLPGLLRLGLTIPLGGTTLFFRRNALEKLGKWDAHNVTEDADLGIRLARYGYRSELIETVTEEEANCRLIPWIKQRSRWLKGYAITWAVHMRSPITLFRQLGAWRFFGFQLLFLGTLSQFVLLPLLWSFWLVPMGIWHPLSSVLPPVGFLALGAVFIFSELTTIATGLLAVRGAKHRFLSIWVPSLHIYFPLGALASYKGLWELLTSPFYWDKTEHGIYEPSACKSSSRVSPPAAHHLPHPT